MSRHTRIVRGSEGPGHRWEMAVRPIPPALRPYVTSLLGYDERTAAPLTRPEYPAPRLPVIIELGPPVAVHDYDDLTLAHRYPGGFAAGLHDAPALVAHQGAQRGVQFDLTPAGAARLFARPPAELARRVVAAADLLPWPHLHERLAALPDWPRRLDLVEDLLLARLADGPRPDWIEHATHRIEATAGALDMATLVRELGYSHGHVTRAFHAHIGQSPKRYARVVRFAALTARLRAGTAASWATLAAEHGYCDQAHLAREIRALTGESPTALLARFGAFTETSKTSKTDD
ncbi:MAG: AraC family transcriptional regulator [Myxococcales bacterium]|nr:AraC family transcriptional regulator [Myxococcales bacterium]